MVGHLAGRGPENRRVDTREKSQARRGVTDPAWPDRHQCGSPPLEGAGRQADHLAFGFVGKMVAWGREDPGVSAPRSSISAGLTTQ